MRSNKFCGWNSSEPPANCIEQTAPNKLHRGPAQRCRVRAPTELLTQSLTYHHVSVLSGFAIPYQMQAIMCPKPTMMSMMPITTTNCCDWVCSADMLRQLKFCLILANTNNSPKTGMYRSAHDALSAMLQRHGVLSDKCHKSSMQAFVPSNATLHV